MAKKSCLIKVLGVVTTVMGMAVSLLSDWVGERKMDEKIDEKVNEALAKKENEES